MATAQIDLSALTSDEKAELRYRLEQREKYAAASEEERKKIQERAQLQADFVAFVKAAWPILEPGNRLSWSWHYDLIAEYLLLASERKVKRLLINIPPRTLKSILITVMFPVWVWTRNPSDSFVCASYADKLSTEHSVKRRRLIESDWFKRIWGERIWLQKDQNEKTKYQNNYQAQMIATSVGGTATGLGGNFLIVDDGLKPDEIGSEAAITSLHNWFDNTWRSRLNNPAEDVMIIVEQRTGDLDLTGHCLDGDKILADQGKEKEWIHLCIPMEADEDAVDKCILTQKFVYPISGQVRERALGDILQPDRNPVGVISARKVLRLVWTTQYQGRPSPLEGNMIKRSEVRYYGGRDPNTGELDGALPVKFDLILTSADCAFKDEKSSDYVCVGTIGVKGPNRYILEIVNKHLDEPATKTEILRQRSKWGSTLVLVEDKANGSSVIKDLKRSIPGLVAVEPEGGKISRMYASCGEWQSGNWFVSRTEAWVEPFIEQITKFPGAKHDDMADMMTQACIHLQKRNYVFGLTEYLKNQDGEMRKKSEERMNKSKAEKVPAKPESSPQTAEESVTAELDIRKVDHVEGITKPDVDDSAMRCSHCQGTAFQRIARSWRCQECGTQTGGAVLTATQGRNAGMFRK